jgi:DNA uptake protein ComE-like DNA-binding protein
LIRGDIEEKEDTEMAQKEPRAQGETHTENMNIDLNTASQKDLERLPAVGKKRDKLIIENRPLENWEDLRRVPGFSGEMIDDLKSGGIELGHS